MRPRSLLAPLAATLGLALGAGPAAAASDVFVNELHYDNAGTDTGEAVEIAAPAGSGAQDTDFAWTGPRAASFGRLNDGQTFDGASGGGGEPAPPSRPSADCGASATPIGAVQGSGAESPLQGREVAVEGVVVGDTQEGLSGVFLQDPRGDGNPATSDGLFAFRVERDVREGDAIRVLGTVTEFGGLTELTDVSSVAVCREDAGVPAATPLALPADDAARERLEGMLVTVAQELAVTSSFNLDQFARCSSPPAARCARRPRSPSRARPPPPSPPRTPGARSCSTTPRAARTPTPSPT